MTDTPTSQRRSAICALLKEGGPLMVTALCRQFNVSAMTIRRDLAALEAEGRLRRTRGGAEPIRTEEYEPAFHIRVKENETEKAAIGRAAAALVADGEVLAVDVGTTLLHLIRALGPSKEVTVLTNWLPNVLELAKYPRIRTIVLGGTLRHAELSLVGGMARDMLMGFNADKAFIGVGGLSIEKGLTDYSMDEVEVKRTMIQTAREVIVLADHTKLDRVAPIGVASLSSVDTLVVDHAITGRQYEMLRGQGLRIVVTGRADQGEEGVLSGP